MRARGSIATVIGLALALTASATSAKGANATLVERLDGKAVMAATVGPLGSLLPHMKSWLERLSELSPEFDLQQVVKEAKAETGIDLLDPKAPEAVGLKADAPVGFHSRDPDHEMTLLLPVLDEAKATEFITGVIGGGGLKKVRKGKYRGASLHAMMLETEVGKKKRKKKVAVAAWAVKNGYLYLVHAAEGKNDALTVLKTALAVTPRKSLAKQQRYQQARGALTGDAGFFYVDLKALMAQGLRETRTEIKKFKKQKDSPEAAFMVPMLEEQLKAMRELNFMQALGVSFELEAKVMVLRSALIGTVKGLRPWTDKLKAPASFPLPAATLAQSAVWATAAIDAPGLLAQLQAAFPMAAGMLLGGLTTTSQALGVDVQGELLPALTGDVGYLMLGVTPFTAANFPDEMIAMQFKHALIVRLSQPAPVFKLMQNIGKLAGPQGPQITQRQDSGSTVYSVMDQGVTVEWGVAGNTAVLTMGTSSAFGGAVAMSKSRGEATDDFFRFAVNGPKLAEWMGQAKLPATPHYAADGEGGKQWVETQRTLKALKTISGRLAAGLDRLTGEFRLELK